MNVSTVQHLIKLNQKQEKPYFNFRQCLNTLIVFISSKTLEVCGLFLSNTARFLFVHIKCNLAFLLILLVLCVISF